MKFKVLLIDDEPGALEGLELWMDWDRLGFEVCGTCCNGQEGLHMIGELEPDLVITDVRMPLMDGLQMIEAWRQEHDDGVKFAIVSGYSEFEYARKALRFGIHHYWLKPIIPEEAEEELMKIRDELIQEQERQRFNRIALTEETVSLIKNVLLEIPNDESGLSKVQALSSARALWNVCLIQSDPAISANVREAAALLSAQEETEYLIDLEPNRVGLVYGYSTGEEIVFGRTIQELSRLYRGQRVVMAVGAGETSLLRIHHCSQTAREAVQHKFYDSDYDGIISYTQVQNRPFHHHYQPSLMDDIIRAVELLDIDGFREAVESAASKFRELWIAPAIVKKMVIHMLYKIINVVKESDANEAEMFSGKYGVSGLTDTLIHLDDLMRELSDCGEESIGLLLIDQARQSQGVIQKINSYIQEHYRENVTIKKLAELFYLHPVYLGQLLIRKNGLGFHELVHNLRIEEAAGLLKQSKLKNSEIAERVGYSHYNQFLKHFEKRHGMSPNEYKSRKF